MKSKIKIHPLPREKFGEYDAKRNVLAARVEWYMRHRNYLAVAKYSLLRLNKYCSIENENPYEINNTAYYAFMYSTDKKIIDGFIDWMKKVVAKTPSDGGNIDTYASLLYKAGRVSEAIEWEERAIKLDPNNDVIKDDFQKMKQGEPLADAVWGYK